MKPIILFFLLLSFSFSQEIPEAPEFGEIPKEDLEMTSFPEDPDADAICLLDLMDLQITSKFEKETRFHQRYKILTEEGKKKANIRIRYYNEDILSGLDAVAYSPDGTEYELDSDNIFEEEVGHTKIISFAIPGVEVGSVIEYKYNLYSEYIAFLDPWYFQSDSYTKLNKLSVILAPGFAYNKVEVNCDSYDIKMSDENVLDPEYTGRNIKKFIWTAQNIPAIKDEPFVDNLGDEHARIYMVLQRFKNQYNDIKISKTWDDIAEIVHKRTKDFLNEDDVSLEKVNELTKDVKNDLDKAEAIYTYVRDEIKQGDFEWYNGDDFKSPEEVIEKKEGGTIEKNFLLINMLRLAGIKANPVLISTRNNGEFLYNFCNLEQFNSILCCAKINGKDFFISTNQKYLDFGSLPYFMNVNKGFMVEDQIGTIININPKTVLNRVEVETNGTLDIDGTLKAKSEMIYRGYPAFSELTKQEDDNYRKSVEDKVKEFDDNAVLDTMYYSFEDSSKGIIKVNIEYTINDYTDMESDYVYVSVPLFTSVSINPFVRQKRNFPVDFPYKIYKSERTRFELPEGITVSEKPNRKKAEMKGCSYRSTFYSGDNYIEVSRSYNLKDIHIHNNFYTDLRELYEVMSTTDEEEFVLLKKKS